MTQPYWFPIEPTDWERHALDEEMEAMRHDRSALADAMINADDDDTVADAVRKEAERRLEERALLAAEDQAERLHREGM